MKHLFFRLQRKRDLYERKFIDENSIDSVLASWRGKYATFFLYIHQTHSKLVAFLSILNQ